MSKSYKLIRRITLKSKSKDWDTAKLEWELEDIFISEEFDECLCGHPILERCILRNKKNGKLITVGNVCINKFFGIATDKMFSAIKRISEDLTRAVNVETVEYSHRKRIINDWEKGFYLDTMKKRHLISSVSECPTEAVFCTMNIVCLSVFPW